MILRFSSQTALILFDSVIVQQLTGYMFGVAKCLRPRLLV